MAEKKWIVEVFIKADGFTSPLCFNRAFKEQTLARTWLKGLRSAGHTYASRLWYDKQLVVGEYDAWDKPRPA